MTSGISLADRWAAALVEAVPVAGTAPELAAALRGSADEVADAVRTGGGSTELGRSVGTVLIGLGLRSASVIGPTVAAVVSSFGSCDLGCVAAVASSLAEGIALVQSEQLLAEQQDLQRAAVAAVRAAEADRRISEARFRAFFTHAAVGIGILDRHGRVIDGNETWAAMMGYSVEEMRGRPVPSMVQAGSDPIALQRFREVLTGARRKFRIEFTHEDRDGRRLEMDLSVSRVTPADGQPEFLVGVALDVTDRRRLADRLWHEARHDPLTGLPNRTLFFERLGEWLEQVPAGGEVGLCYVDLDGFKSVNDSLGHQSGDRLLVLVAERLSVAVRGAGGNRNGDGDGEGEGGTDALLARLGGDEFGVIYRPATPADPGEMARPILAGLAGPIMLGGRELTVSASIGVVDTATVGVATDLLMRAADISLYRAKALGRGRWESYDPLRNALAVTRHTLATEMAAALAHGEFVLEYQPLVSLGDDRVRRVEALLRWRHPRLGLLYTDEFITIAEDNDLIDPLGRWVLEEACRQAGEWHRSFPQASVGINVNVSVLQLHDPGFADGVRAVVTRHSLPPELLHLELTESAVLGDARQPLDALADLAAAGVRLAIDDFGTGYSNLAHLGRLPVSELKLAGSFLSGGPPGDWTNAKIIRAVISLAHSLGLTVTAEGVETEQQADRLRRLNCDEAQGWFFGRPGPAAEISRRLGAEPCPTSS